MKPETNINEHLHEKLVHTLRYFLLTQRVDDKQTNTDERHFVFTSVGDGDLSKASDLRLSCTHQVQSNRYGCYAYNARAFRTSFRARFTLFGLPMALLTPFPLNDEGLIMTGPYYFAGGSDAASLVECLKFLRPGKPLPFDESGKGVANVHLTSKEVDPEHDVAVWSTAGRVVASLNQWLKMWGAPPLDTAEGNALLDALDTVIKAQVVVADWYDGPISRCYNRNGSAPYTSCMKGDDKDVFELYDYMQDKGQLKLVELTRDGLHVGRALVWFGKNPDDCYLDRVYAERASSSDDPNRGALNALSAFCHTHGIRKTVWEANARLLDLEYVRKLRIEVGKNYHYFDKFPYVDSLFHLSHDGWLSTYGYGDYVATLRSTSGSYEGGDGGGEDDDDDNYVTDVNGDRIPCDDAAYVEREGEYYHRDYVTWSDYINEYIPDNNVAETWDGHVVYSDDSRLVELHDGSYALRNEDDIYLLRSGEYALSGDCTCLHDGTYVLNTDDIVELHDGEYAHEDDDIVEVDGVWYLAEDAPETEQTADA